MFSKLIKTTTVAALMFLGTTAATQAASITPYTFSDTGPDYVGASYGASELSVSTILNNYGYTLGGSAIDTTADQTQIQAFQVTGGSADFSIELLATYASYNNDVYVFSGNTPSTLSFQKAFTNNVDPIGTSFDFTVAENDYFGFVIHADGNNPPSYSTVNSLSTDGLDHALIFNTDQSAYVVAFEDLAYKSSTNTLGDQDYNDVVFSLTGSAIPEPASAGLLLLGAGMLLGRPKRRTA
ncbi:MAG TPA: hypothetical protein DCM28_13080 [Phycisphaerales bacterium]|nr:hypothetical protein [Phycisphaerales bacterium]HCD35056.1 hypothetical protein [Phycisphaerales bacterium]|tara:strand:- start:32393 stop:33109 length:717 start_codon:yes stop_codon:yes gene_type:complete